MTSSQRWRCHYARTSAPDYFCSKSVSRRKKKQNGSDNNDCCACVGVYFHSPSESFTYKQSDMIIILLLYNTAAAVCVVENSPHFGVCFATNLAGRAAPRVCILHTRTHTYSLVCTLNMYNNMRHPCYIMTTIM